MKQQAPKVWRKLDNAAKIFPANSHGEDTKVFRYSCQLKDKVDFEILQKSVDETMPDFPSFGSVLRQGIFWFYLEESRVPIKVEKEKLPPCTALYINSKSPLLRVVYYENRFSVELYHSITDGTGAVQFFKVLVSRYLSLAHQRELDGRLILPEYDSTIGQRMGDSFEYYYDKKAKHIKKEKAIKAAQIKAAKNFQRRMTIIEGTAPVDKLKELSKQYDTTVTVFLTAVLLSSIAQTLKVSERKKPVALSIPVNLRNFFSSATCRNFFSVFETYFNFENELPPLEDVINKVKADFAEKLVKENFAARLARLASLERNVPGRLVPLPLKNFGMNIGYKISSKNHTASYSNVGKIVLPDELCKYVEGFDVFNSTGKILLITCSFMDTMRLSFTSSYINSDIQRTFFKYLTSCGVPVTITATEKTTEEDE